MTGLRLFGYGFGAHYLGDLLQHVADVEAALGRSPFRDDGAVVVALDFYLETFEEALDTAGCGAIEVRVGTERWRLGTADVVASVSASGSSWWERSAAGAPWSRSAGSTGPATSTTSSGS